MKMNVEFESKEDVLSFVSMFRDAKDFMPSQGQAAPVEVKKEDKTETKPTVEKIKKDKADKSKAEDKKDEASKVEAEVTGVDTTSKEPPKDAEVKEDTKKQETANITKEMVRAICSKAIKAGKSAEVKNIVGKYGASKLPDLNEECYADAYKDVEALL